MQAFLVFLGGGVGATVRYLSTGMITARVGNEYSFLGTLFVNVIGSFLMGVLVEALPHLSAHYQWDNVMAGNLRYLLAVGFLGGLTTFSSFSLDTISLFSAGALSLSILNIVLNLVLGFFALAFGIYLVRLVL